LILYPPFPSLYQNNKEKK